MSDDVVEPRPVWRRAAAAARVAGSDEPLRCGGPELTAEEIYQKMKARREARLAEEARKREEAEANRAARRSASAAPAKDEEDEDKAAERFRNDRYAVKLLRQDDDAWGGGSALPGGIG